MAHKLKITLQYTEPKIYRTVVVPEHFSFHELHYVIQCVMPWNNSHLYQFNTGRAYASDIISLINTDDEMFFGGFSDPQHDQYDANKTFLADFFNGKSKKMSYIYDLGDDWTHHIIVLKKPSEEVLISKCIKGENPAPIDDCGGIPGFYEIVEISKLKRKNEEEQEIMEWYGIPKNKTYEEVYKFDIDQTNLLLAEFFR